MIHLLAILAAYYLGSGILIAAAVHGHAAKRNIRPSNRQLAVIALAWPMVVGL